MPTERRTSLIVCKRSGQMPPDCGLFECENGCSEVELEFEPADAYDTLATENRRLRSALERLLANARHIFDKQPVRDWDETLREAEAALNPTDTPSPADAESVGDQTSAPDHSGGQQPVGEINRNAEVKGAVGRESAPTLPGPDEASGVNLLSAELRGPDSVASQGRETCEGCRGFGGFYRPDGVLLKICLDCHGTGRKP